MAEKELDLTFGVEIQCILAFHESYLQMHLDEIGDTSSIIKTMTEDQRVRLYGGRAADFMKQYMGWALTSQISYPVDRPPVSHDAYVDCHREFGFRPYAHEISCVAQKILPGPPEVHSPRIHGSITDFSNWYVSDNPNLLGADKKTMKIKLSGKIVEDDRWDAHGLVLISPRTLAPTMTGFYDIADYLSELVPSAPSSRHSAFTTQRCGLHVHLGLSTSEEQPSKKMFTLATLQHLTYIVTIYELEIGKMHASHRRISRSMGVISELRREKFALRERNQLLLRERNRANRLVTCGMPGAPESAHQLYEDQRSVIDQEMQSMLLHHQTLRRRLLDPYYSSNAHGNNHSPHASSDDPISYSETRKRIFAPDMTVEKLNDQLNKDRIINFTSLLLPGFDGPRTIEFRQHEGTLDIDAIKWWTLFVVGLVQLASRMAREFGNAEDYGGEGYPHITKRIVGFGNGDGHGEVEQMDEDERPAKIEELWDLMAFSQDGRRFFKGGMRVWLW